MSSLYKLVVYVPETHADEIRSVLGKRGAGKLGNYSHCTFSVKGTGRFLPLAGAHPAIGSVGELAEVPEERIETLCPAEEVTAIVAALKAVHPYEEPAIDLFPLGFLPV